ncbi:LOW QUALITY PROTEIN: hypothetical protein V1477_006444 [Vespula maculifrons]|uniref:Uncharacterized protein n=1 Tax=Vespula maculifrons TaxID=7453 RepID=A0ABD2CLJ3_VESMC
MAPRRTGPGSFERARRVLYAHIFCHLGEPDWCHWKMLVAPSTPIFLCTDRTNRSRFKGNIGKKHCSLRIFLSETIAPRRTGPGSFVRARRALYAHIFCVQIGPIGAEIFLYETIALRRTLRGSLERARQALYAHIFFVQIGTIGAEGSKGKKNFSFTIFFSETIAPRRTGPGSFERARRVLYAHIFCVQIGPIGAEEQRKKNFSLTIFFFGTIAPRRTRLGSSERARRALYAHIFFDQIGPIVAKIFLSETIAPRRTGPGSFVRARRALYAHIFCVQIGPIGAERTERGSLERARRALYAYIFFVQIGPIGAEWNKGEKNFSLTIFFSGTKAPRRTRLGSLESARRALYAHIFFDQIGPKVAERTGPGSFVRARRALYAHIFCVQIGPIGAEIFLYETVAYRRTGPGSFERARRALYAHIFCVQIGPIGADTYENRSRVSGKGSSRPLRPYFLRTDRTYTSRFKGNKGKKHCSLRIFLSETIASRRTGPGSFERARRALYAHIFFDQIGPNVAEKKKFFFNNLFLRNNSTYENRTRVSGKGSSRPLRPYFPRPDRTNRSRVITDLGEPYGGSKGKKNFSFTIFFSETIAPRRTGPGSFERARRVLYAHIFCVQIGPIGAEVQRKKNFSLTIFFFGTIAPRRTRLGSSERARRALYAHIFFDQIGPIFKDNKGKKHFSLTIFFSETIAPRRTGPRSFERGRRALYAHIFRVQHLGEPDRGRLKELVAPSTPIFSSTRSVQNTYENRTRVSGKGSSRPLRPYFSPTDRTNRSGFKGNKGKKHCSLRIFLSETIAPRRTERGSLERARRALYAYIVFVQIGPIGAEWNKGKKNFSFAIFFSETVAPRRTGPGSFERARRALYAHIFFVQIGPIGAELLQFKDNKGKKHFYLRIFLSETIAPRRTGPRSFERKKHFSLTIFFSETVSPRRTGPGSFERARRALYAHIFCVQENQSGVIGKGSSRPLRPYFPRPDRTNRSRVITVFREQRKKNFSLTIFFSETIAPRRTGPGSFVRARRALYAHIFCVQIGPIGAERTLRRSLERARQALYAHIFFVQIGTIGAEGSKGKKNFSFTIFFSETIAPRRTGPGSFERARRVLYAHIFCVQIGPIGAEVQRKKNFSLTIFFFGTIAPRRTRLGSSERARRALYAHIFFDQIGPIFKDNKGKKHFSLTIFFSETIAPRRTGPRSFERGRRALYAHIFRVQHLGEPDRGRLKELVAPSTPIFSSTRSHLREPDSGLWKGLVALSTLIFFAYRSVQNTYENRTRVSGKGSSRPLRPYFSPTDRTNRSGFKGNKGKKHCSLRIFLSETIAPRRTERGSLERARRALYAYIVFVQIGPIGAEWNKGKKNFSFAIFFSETVAPRRTGPGSFERARRALYAHIFFVQIGPIGAELLQFKDNKGKKHFYLRIFLSETIAPRRTGPRSFERKKHFSLTIFFSETVSPRRTGPGSFERARRALYAHIFCVQENQSGVIGKGSSRPLRPYFPRPDRTNRSRVITVFREQRKKNFSLTIFFSETIAPRRTGPGSFVRARRALYAHIFCVQIGPIGAEGSKGKKNFSFTIFFSETIAPRRTGPGSFERARRVLYAHIFCVQIGPIGAEVQRKKNFSLTIFFFGTIAPRRTRLGSSERARRALYAHIFFDQIGPIFKDNKGKKHFSLTIFFSETIAPRRTGPRSFERGRRALYAHIFRVQGTKEKKIFFLQLFSPELYDLGEPGWGHWKGLVAPSMPIFSSTRSHLGEPDRGRLKELVAPSTPIFSSTRSHLREPDSGLWKGLVALSTLIFFAYRSVQNTYENRTRVSGKGSSRPLRPYFSPTDRTNRSGFKGNKGKKHCSLRIFLSETIAPRRTERGSLERARRALYAYIVFVQIGPIGAEWNKGKKNFSFAIFFSETVAPRRTGPGSFERARRALYAHIFFVQIGPIGAELLQFKDNKGKKHFYLRIFLSETIAPRRTGPRSFERKKHFSLTIFFSETVSPRRTGPGSFERARRALYAHIFCVQENQSGVIGKGSSRPLRPYFPRPDRTNRSRVITVFREQRKKNFSLTIFFSETIAPRRTGPGSFVRARRALYAHIFCVQIGPIGAEGSKGKKNFSFTIFFSETIAPRRTGPGSFKRARRVLYAHIFCHLGEPDWGHRKGLVAPSTHIFSSTRSHLGEPDRGRLKELVASSTHIFFAYRSDQKEPIYNGNKGKKNFSLTIFFSGTKAPRRTRLVSLESAHRALYAHIFVIFLSETVAPRRTGPGSFVRARRALYAHIFCVQIGPIGAERTRLGSLESARRALYAHIFFDQIGPKVAEEQRKKIFFFTIFFSETIAPRRTGPGSFVRALRALYAHIFCVQIGPIGAERTGPGSLESARRALYAHIFFDQIRPKVAELKRFKESKGKKHFSLTIFFSETVARTSTGAGIFLSETIASRRTGPGSFERARRALYAHIFCVQIGPIGADTYENRSRVSGKGSSSPLRPYFLRTDRTYTSRVMTHLGEPDRGRLKGLVAPSTHIFSSTRSHVREPSRGRWKRARHALYAHIFFVQIGPIEADTYENRSRVSGKGSSRPLRPYFLRTDRTNRSRFKDIKGKKHFSLTIFFSETIAPRRTGPGSFERGRHTLYAHIFCVQHLGERDLDRWKGLVAPSTLIFSSTRSDQNTYENRSRVSVKGSSRPLRPYFLRTDRTNRSRFKGNKGKKHCSLRISLSETIAPRRTEPGSLGSARHALYAHIFFVQIGPIEADTYENRSRVSGKGSSRPLRPYFLRTDRTYRSRFKDNKGKKHFSLTIFFSETIAPRRTRTRSFERGRRALYAHIFRVKHLGEPDRGRLKELVAPSTPIFSSTRSENGTLIIGKDSSRPLRPYFLPPDRTNRSRVITHLGEPYRGHWKGLVKPSTHIFFCPDRTKSSRVITNKGKKYFSLTISFSETVARTRTGAGYLERARRALYAHIFCVQIGPIGAEIFLSETIAPRRTGPGSFERARRALYAHIFFDQIGPKVADTYENRTRVTGKGSSRPLRPYFFRTGWTNRSRENQSGVIGKGSSRPLRPYFLRPDRANRSRVITHLGEPYGGHWKGLVKPSTHIFFCPDRNNRSRVITHLGEPDRGRLKELVASSTHIFFAYRSDQEEPIYNAPRRTGTGSVERGHRALYAHIFCVQIGPIGAEIFFSETIAPTRTRPGSFKGLVAPSTPIFFAYRTYENRARVIGKGPSRPLRPYFLRTDRTNRSRHQREPDYGQWKGSVAPSTTIFFAYTPRRTGPGSFERARGALYAHIFCVHIGPIGAEEQKTIVPRRTGPGSFERARRFLYAHIFYEPSYNGLQGTKEKKLFFNNFFLRNYNTYENRTLIIGKDTSRPLLPHFFRPDRTNRSRAITENRTLIIGKDPSRPLRPYFLRTDRTNRSRVITHLAEPSGGHWKGLVASSTHIFFTTYENRTLIIGKGSSRPLRTYFLRTDRTNRSRVITHLGEPEQGQWKGAIAPSTPIFFAYRSDQWEPTIARTRTEQGSVERARRALYAHIFCVHIGPIGAEIFLFETIAPRRTRPGSLERPRRALYAHIFCVQIGPIGAESRVITVYREQRKKNYSLTIFFLRNYSTYENRTLIIGKDTSRPLRPHFFRPDRTNRSRAITENRTLIIGKGSSRPLRPYFLRTDRTNRSRVITLLREPDLDHWKGHVARSTPIFFSSRSFKENKGKKHFSLTIFFSETIAPRRTGPGSFERGRCVLYAHIFYENWNRVSGKGPSRPPRPYFLRTDRTNRSRVITHLGEPYRGRLKGSSLPLRPYFLRTDQTNRSRVITYVREPNQGKWKGPVAPSTPIFFATYENRTVIIGKGPSRPLRPYFLRTDRTNRSRVITHLGEPDRGHLKGSSRPLRPYFFRPDRTNRSRVITHLGELEQAPWRTGPGSFERARRVLYVQIFRVQIGPIGADTYENRSRVSGKGSSRPLRPHFLRTYRTNRSRYLREPDLDHWKGLVASSTHIFFTTYENRTLIIGEDSSRPLRQYFFRPDRTNRSRAITEKKFSLTIFFSENIAPSRAVRGSLERARGVLYAHIFYENRNRVSGKGPSRPLRPYFLRTDRTNRSRVITHLGEPDRGRLKGSSRPLRPYFLRTDRTNRSGVITGTKENKFFLTIFFSEAIARTRTEPGSVERGHSSLYAHIFCVQIGPIGAEIFFSGTIAHRRTRPGSLERARRALYDHIFCVQIGPIGAEIFLSETIALRRTRPGSFESARGALYAHIFFVQMGPIGAALLQFKGSKGKKHLYLTIFFSGTIAHRRTRPGSLERARRALYDHIFCVQIGPIGAERTGPGSLERPRRALYAHIFCVQMEPIGAEELRKKKFFLTIFFSETIARTRTGAGYLERARRALYAHIFCVHIGPIGADTYENRTLIIGKDSSRPLRPHFFRPYRTNRSRAITENRTLIIGKDSSRPLRPHFFSLDRTNRSRVITHLGEPDRGRLKGSSRRLRPYFLHTDRTNRSRVITNLGEPDRGRLKGLVAHSTPIFLRTDGTYRSRVITHLGEPARGRLKGIFAHSTPIFLRTDRTYRSRVITHVREPGRGHWKVLVAPSTPIFLSSR